jgi:hypothetical protein
VRGSIIAVHHEVSENIELCSLDWLCEDAGHHALGGSMNETQLLAE